MHIKALQRNRYFSISANSCFDFLRVRYTHIWSNINSNVSMHRIECRTHDIVFNSIIYIIFILLEHGTTSLNLVKQDNIWLPSCTILLTLVNFLHFCFQSHRRSYRSFSYSQSHKDFAAFLLLIYIWVLSLNAIRII